MAAEDIAGKIESHIIMLYIKFWQVANSNHTIDPERIRSLVKKYVAKYKGSRERSSKGKSDVQQDVPFTFSP